MAYQNINQYKYQKYYLTDVSSIQDFSLANDERQYKEEVIFSPYVIAENDGNKLPIYIDFDNIETNQQLDLSYYDYNQNNILVSKNYYNPNNDDLNCFSSTTLCDIGLTGIDNGLVSGMTGQSITYTMGLLNSQNKFNRLSFDRRFKMFQPTGLTTSDTSVYNPTTGKFDLIKGNRFSGFTEGVSYGLINNRSRQGYYIDLYGGFYQGFYKLFGYDYEIMPLRPAKGWTMETIVKPRVLLPDYDPLSGYTTLNQIYPNNSNIFFYFGTRAENKFYHRADGTPSGYTAYTRVTSGLTCLETAGCSNSACTSSDCHPVYSETGDTKSRYWNTEFPFNVLESTLPPDNDPKFDSMSNSLALKFSGDPKNPILCVRILRWIANCVSGACNSGVTYVTGYTIQEYCTTKGINYLCEDTNYIDYEHWVQIDLTYERYSWYDYCDLLYLGGLGDVTKNMFTATTANKSITMIEPPTTHLDVPLVEREVVKLTDKWLLDKKYRDGRLKLYVNGKLFETFENIEELIPRGLETEREKQLGVPLNISWGGGTQGLRENLTFSGCPTSLTGNTYQQDPECFPNNDLSGTTYSGLSTNILIEQNFAGTFDGSISQFRFYVEPLSSDEVKHNWRILRNKFDLLNPDCPDCNYVPTPVYLLTQDFDFVLTQNDNNIITKYV